MEIILLLIRLFLAAVFGVAGVAKLLDPKGSEKAVRDFGVPENLSKQVAYALPIAEIVIAVFLLPVTTAWFGAVGGLLLLLAFIGGMLVQIAKGNAPDCHCFGQLHSEPVGKKSLIRNGLFGVLALFLAIQGPNGQGASLVGEGSGVQMLFNIAIIGLLAAAIFYLRQILKQQADILRRFEVLGLLEAADEPVERNDAGDPHDGLPIGAGVPEFELPDINGRMVHFDHLLASAKPVLFFFVGPTCHPCELLLPEIKEWEPELKDRVTIVFVSSGQADENRKKFGSDRTVLLDKDRKFALSVNAKWTPTALLAGTDGNIASHLAAGDTAIRRLVEKIMHEDLEKEWLFFTGINGHGRPMIGQKVPEFSLTDINGRTITEAFFRGKKTLAYFSSPSCGHCKDILPVLRDWERAKSEDQPQLIVFSEGDPEEHRKYELQAPILLEPHYDVAKQCGMIGAPSAVVIDENGTIITETAIGQSNIWSLVIPKKIVN